MGQLKTIILPKLMLLGFLTALFFIKIPPFYLTSFTSRAATSHILAKGMILVVFFYLLLSRANWKKLNHAIIIQPLLFFLATSLTIFAAQDIILFLKDYQNIVFFLLIFFIGIIYGQDKKKQPLFNKFILYLGIFAVVLDAIYFLFGKQLITIFSGLIQKEILPLYVINLKRDRYSLYLNTELFLPFFMSFYLITKKNKDRYFYFFLILLTIFFALVSNFRHRLLLILFVFLGYVFLIFLKRKKIKIMNIFAIFIFLIVFGIGAATVVTRTFFKSDIINRLLLEDKSDVDSTESRINHFFLSADLLKYSPILGVGLGNYQLYIKDKGKFSTQDPLLREFNSNAVNDPHSIISKTMAESGFLGIISFILMLIFFLHRDIQFIRKNSFFMPFAYILSFWSLFVLSLITPSITIFRGGWTWFLRGLLEGYYISTSQKNSDL